MPQIDLGQVVGPPGQDGADGQDGAPGAAAAITGASASATTLSAGSSATAAVTANGTDASRSFAFTFGIPKGDKGDTGAAGPSNITTDTATSITGVLKGNGSKVSGVTVDSAPDSSHTNNLISSAGVADALAKEIIKVNFGTLTGTGGTVTVTKSTEDAAKITADHELIGYALGTPSAQAGNLTVNTSAGAVSVSGSINGSTTLTIYLGLPGTTVS